MISIQKLEIDCIVDMLLAATRERVRQSCDGLALLLCCESVTNHRVDLDTNQSGAATTVFVLPCIQLPNRIHADRMQRDSQ